MTGKEKSTTNEKVPDVPPPNDALDKVCDAEINRGDGDDDDDDVENEIDSIFAMLQEEEEVKSPTAAKTFLDHPERDTFNKWFDHTDTHRYDWEEEKSRAKPKAIFCLLDDDRLREEHKKGDVADKTSWNGSSSSDSTGRGRQQHKKNNNDGGAADVRRRPDTVMHDILEFVKKL